MKALSDGAFKLYMFLCLRADRSTGWLEVDQASIAKSLGKSRRSVIAYFEELKQRGVCTVRFAANQHSRGSAQICERFWPYVIPTGTGDHESSENYIERIRMLMKTRSCVSLTFAPADEKLARSLFSDRIPMLNVEHAFLLGCTRKYVSWLNGHASQPIASLGYFRSIIEEVTQLDASPDYWRYISESLDKYERAWLNRTTTDGGSVP